MKKLYILPLLLLLLILTACDSKELINEVDGIKLYQVDNGACATALELIFEDEQNEYYLRCISSDWYEIDDNGTNYSLQSAVTLNIVDGELLNNLFNTDDQSRIYIEPKPVIVDPVEELDYYDERLTFITSNTELLSQDAESYYVYMFSPTCSHCLSIKQEVLEFVFNELNEPFFIIDAYDYTKNDGYSDWGQYVPTLIKIVNGEIVEEYVGTIEVRTCISDYVEAQE